MIYEFLLQIGSLGFLIFGFLFVGCSSFLAVISLWVLRVLLVISFSAVGFFCGLSSGFCFFVDIISCTSTLVHQIILSSFVDNNLLDI